MMGGQGTSSPGGSNDAGQDASRAEIPVPPGAPSAIRAFRSLPIRGSLFIPLSRKPEVNL